MAEIDFNDLKDLIQEKKESQDYYTIQQGLLTERDCFEAIEALGHRIYVIKEEIDKLLKAGEDPQSNKALQSMVMAGEHYYRLQLRVINDVCARFEVIHPQYDNPSEDLLRLKQRYWDWYKDQYQKYYGRPAPIIGDK